VSYVDALLVHWPTPSQSQGNVSNPDTVSTDRACNQSAVEYNEKTCRLDTWRAMVEIFNAGGARAIGVSNYNVTHFQEIVDAGLPLPALTQSPFHLYHSTAQAELIAFCRVRRAGGSAVCELVGRVVFDRRLVTLGSNRGLTPLHVVTFSIGLSSVLLRQAHNILFLGYSPLGVPDDHVYPTNISGVPTGMSASQLVSG
jgi:diketogulonate reductase-like aldo/keto reductase